MTHDRMESNERIRQSVDAWARTIPGAPRRFHELLTAVESHDDVVMRLATVLVRRDLYMERDFATQPGVTPLRVHPSQIDPFAYSNESLRAATEHRAACTACRQSGTMTCEACQGTGKHTCPRCQGTGQELREYKTRPSKHIQCKQCRTKGIVKCTKCGTSGSLTCEACRGLGVYASWVQFRETRRIDLRLEPPRSPLSSEASLSAPYVLDASQLSRYPTAWHLDAPGRLDLAALPPPARAWVEQEDIRFDPQSERIEFQQFVQVSRTTVHATYAMCGASGQLSLEAPEFAVLASETSLRPIRRRRKLWPVIVAALAIGAALVRVPFTGSAEYFEPTNRVTGALLLASIPLSIPWIGGLLRAWAPRSSRRARLRWSERVAGMGWLGAVAAIILVGFAGRPTVEEARQYLSAGDVARAKIVAEALEELRPEDSLVAAVEDEVLWIQAERAHGEVRLELLDRIAERDGELARRASLTAREERLAAIRATVAENKPDEALATIQRWFGDAWRADAEVAEQVAEIHGLRIEQCRDSICALEAATAANDAASSEPRLEAVTTTRRTLLAALQASEEEAPSALERVQALDRLERLASDVSERLGEDPELRSASVRALQKAQGERHAIPLLGSTLEVIEGIVGSVVPRTPKIYLASLDGAELYFAMSDDGTCQGVYAVGPAKRRRVLGSEAWGVDRVASQALGRAVSMKSAKDNGGVARWNEGGVPIVARWHSGNVVELRVGSADPAVVSRK